MRLLNSISFIFCGFRLIPKHKVDSLPGVSNITRVTCIFEILIIIVRYFCFLDITINLVFLLFVVSPVSINSRPLSHLSNMSCFSSGVIHGAEVPLTLFSFKGALLSAMHVNIPCLIWVVFSFNKVPRGH